MGYVELNNVFETINAYYIGQKGENERACACIDLWSKIKSLPASDVVSVVRCKDCKYYYAYPDEYRTCHENYEIDGVSKIMAIDDFCSKGQRRECQEKSK